MFIFYICMQNLLQSDKKEKETLPKIYMDIQIVKSLLGLYVT